jgi:hypothetical protein
MYIHMWLDSGESQAASQSDLQLCACTSFQTEAYVKGARLPVHWLQAQLCRLISTAPEMHHTQSLATKRSCMVQLAAEQKLF